MRATLLSLFLMAVSALGPADAGAQEGRGVAVEPMLSAKTGRFRALLVGVNDYEKLKDLSFCEEDVRGLRDQLVKMGFRRDTIKCLTTGDTDPAFRPSYRNVTERLDALFAGLDTDSVLVIALSGHGGSFEFRESSGGEHKESFYCPQDARINDPRGTMIPVKSIYDRLEQCPARFKMLLVDACRDPHIAPPGARTAIDEAKTMAGFARSLADGILPKGTLALVSCTSGEQSYEDPTLKHGIFMYYLLEGLSGRADAAYRGNRDEMVSYRELKDYVYRKTSDHAWRKWDQPQTPEFRANWELPDFGLAVATSLIEARKALDRGDAFERDSQWKKALQAYDLAVTLDPTSIEAMVRKANCHCMLNEYAAAATACASAVRIDSNDARVIYLRCRIMANDRGWNDKEVVEELRRASRLCGIEIDRTPDDVRKRSLRRAICNSLGNATEDEDYYRRALLDARKMVELDPNDGRAYCDRATAYNNLEQYDKAIEDCNTGIALAPKFADLFRVRAYAYNGKSEWSRAIEDAGKAIELDPKCTAAFAERAIAYGSLGQYDKAIQDCDAAIALDPKSHRLFCTRAYAYNGISEWSRAIEDASKAIELDAKCEESFRSRAKAYNNLKQYDKAIEDCDAAIALDPKSAYLFCERAFAYCGKSEWNRAIKDANKAIDLDPKDAAAYAIRAFAYEKRGQTGLAEQDRKKAQELEQ